MEEPKAPHWSDGLLPEQKDAASHDMGNGRLLAGPGTGKTHTLRARVEFLILEKKVEPKSVTALTFTRAAAGELRNRVEKVLEGKVADRPQIMTLHAFALRTLLKNAALLDALPKPLRIADDWEERNIIAEDLKAVTQTSVKEVRKNFQALSADWETLRADAGDPNKLTADATFVGSWVEHRKLYGYTLRSELVYQLKRAIEQHGNLDLGAKLEHLLVDEYQDLNACDLSVIAKLAATGAKVYAAGDDDQSIYGFRQANPEGIRKFDKDHPPSKDLPLATCMRCDREIMELSQFVANLDPKRLKKPWEARPGAGEGEVHLLRFSDGATEAQAIASVCKHLISDRGVIPDEILILIRSDRNGAFTMPLADEMQKAGVPFSLNVESTSPLDTNGGRIALSFMRLAANENDSLAWRTLLQVRKQGFGEKAIQSIVDSAKTSGTTFAQALRAAKLSDKLALEYARLDAVLTVVKAIIGDPEDVLTAEQVEERLGKIGAAVGALGVPGIDEANAHILELAKTGEADSFATVLGTIAMSGLTPEQERARGAVNMLTMHKAKGLTADAVIIMACEDEYVPGRQQGVDEEPDERRLLYVSLTRARHSLYITYAQKRDGPQRHTGRDSGKAKRTLTRFLRNAPVHAEPGDEFVAGLGAP